MATGMATRCVPAAVAHLRQLKIVDSTPVRAQDALLPVRETASVQLVHGASMVNVRIRSIQVSFVQTPWIVPRVIVPTTFAVTLHATAPANRAVTRKPIFPMVLADLF